MTPTVEWDPYVREAEIAAAQERADRRLELARIEAERGDARYDWKAMHATITIADNRHADPNWPRRPHLLDIVERKIVEHKKAMLKALDEQFWYPCVYYPAFENGGCRQ